MALRVGELYASLSLRTNDFDSGLDKSKGKFDGLKSAITSGTRVVAQAFAGTLTATTALGVAALKVGVNYNRMQQSSRAALATLLGSAEAANAQMDKLDDFASNSPFAKDVFIRAQQQLLGFGVAAEDVVPTLDAIQNAVAAMGGGNDTITSITYALSRMQSQGKLSGETLRDLGVYGIDAAAIVGEAMGKSGEEIREMASKPGGIPVGEVWDPLVNGLMEKFGGATAGMKEQMDGAVDRIKAAWRDIGSVLAAPFVDPKGGGMAVEWTNKFADAMRAAQAKAAPLVDLLVTRFAPGLSAITPLLESARGAINSWDLSKVNGQLDRLSGYTPLIAGASTALFALGTTNLPILSQLGFAGINPVVAGLAALVATSPEVRSALGDVMRTMEPLLPIAKGLGEQLADVLMRAIETLAPALGDLGVAFGDAGVILLTSFAPAIVAALDATVPVIDVLADLIRWVSDLPTPILTAVAAFAAFRSLNLVNVFKPASDALKVFNERAALQATLAGSSSTAVGKMGAAAVIAQGGVQRLGTALKTAFISNPIGIAIMAITTALGAFAAKAAEIKAAGESYKQTLDEMGNKTSETTEHIIEQISKVKGRDWLESAFGNEKSIIERAERIGVATEDVIGYIQGEEDAIRRLAEVTDAFIEGSDGKWERKSNTESVKILTGLLDDEREALELGSREARQAAGAYTELGSKQRDAADAADKHTKALQDQQDQIQSAYDATLNLAEAQLRQKDAQDRSTDAIQRYKDVSEDEEATDRDKERAKRDMESALLSEVGAYRNVTGAMERQNESAVELNKVIADQRQQFINTATQMGINEQEAKDLADAYGLIPNRVDTEMVASGFGMALSAAQDLQNTLNNIDGKQVTAFMAVQQYGQAHMADGGILQGGVQSFADGGVRGRLPSFATIQAPQANLVQWAEPETGGEAFIPLAPSKRSRSLAILDEVAKRFGLATVPVRSRADGGVDGGRPSAPSSRSMDSAPFGVTVHAHGPDAHEVGMVVAMRVGEEIERKMTVQRR